MIRLVARCYLSGEFRTPGGATVSSLMPGDEFEADEANAASLIRRRQAEPAAPAKPKRSRKAKPSGGE